MEQRADRTPVKSEVSKGSIRMAGLGCGSFGLSNNVTQNKSYVHVKLTDSAFRAIEDYLRIKVSVVKWEFSALLPL